MDCTYIFRKHFPQSEKHSPFKITAEQPLLTSTEKTILTFWKNIRDIMKYTWKILHRENRNPPSSLPILDKANSTDDQSIYCTQHGRRPSYFELLQNPTSQSAALFAVNNRLLLNSAYILLSGGLLNIYLCRQDHLYYHVNSRLKT